MAALPPAYPTASYQPAIEMLAAEQQGGYGDVSSYVAAPTYAPPLHVTEVVHPPYQLGGYGQQASASYLPPNYAYSGVAGPTYSYQPPVASFAPSYSPGIIEPAIGSYGSPMAMQGRLSFVPPGTGSYVPSPPPAGPPPKLTEGIPDPASVEAQKRQYEKSIEAQLKQEQTHLNQRNQAQKQLLQQHVEAQKAQYNLQMDQYLRQQAMEIDQQGNVELIQLQQAAMNQKKTLEQQASALCLEFQQRKVQEEMMMREYLIHKEYYESGVKLMQQYQKQQPPAPNGSFAARPGGVSIGQYGGLSSLQPTASYYVPTVPTGASQYVPTVPTGVAPHVVHQPSVHHRS
jgi:hypothetical protein